MKMKLINILSEEYLSRMKPYLTTSKLAIAFSASLFLYTPASANPQTSIITHFDPIMEYCEQTKDGKHLSLSEVIMNSSLPYEELSYEDRRILVLHYEGLTKEELDDICLERNFVKIIPRP